MTWFFNDQEIEASERYMITFDGTYATLFIASCVMEDMGEYKVVFENSAGTDETTGKVTVKPVSAPPPHSKSQIFKVRRDHCIQTQVFKDSRNFSKSIKNKRE